MSLMDLIFGKLPDPFINVRDQLKHEKWLVEKSIEMKKLEIELLKLRKEFTQDDE